jgi:hypothetical protein
MTWGNKLVIVFLAFAGLMSTLVYKCMNQNFELVSKDYYNDELRYQDKIDGMNNANKLSGVTLTQAATDDVVIKLPKELDGLSATGTVWFYCPTSSVNDRKIPLQVNDEGVMSVQRGLLAATNYLVKITWQIGDDKYYSEKLLAVK